MTLEDQVRGFSEETFAIRFVGGGGVDAKDFGEFITQAAKISQRQGIVLQITAIERGSVIAVLRAIREEFNNSPVSTTANGATLVALAAGAIVSAFSLVGTPKPIANAAAKMVIDGKVTSIELITNTSVVVLIDQQKADVIRAVNERKAGQVTKSVITQKTSRFPESHAVRLLSQSAKEGTLVGNVYDVEGRKHFRPDNFNYLVPVSTTKGSIHLRHGGRYRIEGFVKTHDGWPDEVKILNASQF